MWLCLEVFILFLTLSICNILVHASHSAHGISSTIIIVEDAKGNETQKIKLSKIVTIRINNSKKKILNY